MKAKLVRKIQKGGFVDTAELLRDNMEGAPKPSRLSCIVAEKQPERVKELWGLPDAHCSGGETLRAYDSMFRQQAANNPKVVSTSFLANQNQRGPYCMETDHELCPRPSNASAHGKGCPTKALREGGETSSLIC